MKRTNKNKKRLLIATGAALLVVLALGEERLVELGTGYRPTRLHTLAMMSGAASADSRESPGDGSLVAVDGILMPWGGDEGSRRFVLSAEAPGCCGTHVPDSGPAVLVEVDRDAPVAALGETEIGTVVGVLRVGDPTAPRGTRRALPRIEAHAIGRRGILGVAWFDWIFVFLISILVGLIAGPARRSARPSRREPPQSGSEVDVHPPGAAVRAQVTGSVVAGPTRYRARRIATTRP